MQQRLAGGVGLGRQILQERAHYLSVARTGETASGKSEAGTHAGGGGVVQGFAEQSDQSSGAFQEQAEAMNGLGRVIGRGRGRGQIGRGSRQGFAESGDAFPDGFALSEFERGEAGALGHGRVRAESGQNLPRAWVSKRLRLGDKMETRWPGFFASRR